MARSNRKSAKGSANTIRRDRPGPLPDSSGKSLRFLAVDGRPGVAQQQPQLVDQELLIAKKFRPLRLAPFAQEHNAFATVAEHCPQYRNDLGQKGYAPTVACLDPPPQLRLVPHRDPTAVEIDVFEEQMGQFVVSVR